MKSIGRIAFCLLFVCFLMTGCGPQTASEMIREANSTNSKTLANLYMMYQANHSWQGPADEATFKEFISNADPAILDEMGVDASKIEELFVSERDGEDFQIRYGVAGGMGASDPVIFETTGKNGKRVIGFTAMREEQVSSDEIYQQMWSGNAARQVNRRETYDGAAEGKKK